MIIISSSPYAFDGVRWYLVFAILAVAVIIGWALLQARKEGGPSYRTVTIAALVMVPAGIIFARLFHVVDYPGYYLAHPDRIVSLSGVSIYGAITGAVLALWLFSKLRKFSFGGFVDMLTPAIIVGQAIGRVGCLTLGCCHGVETDLPWGIVYTSPWSVAEQGVKYHPYQVYEIIILMLILAVVLWLRSRVKFKIDGTLFACYLAMYSVWRLSSGFIRPNNSFFLGIHQAQVVAILILAVTVPLLLSELCNKKRVEIEAKSPDKIE